MMRQIQRAASITKKCGKKYASLRTKIAMLLSCCFLKKREEFFLLTRSRGVKNQSFQRQAVYAMLIVIESS